MCVDRVIFMNCYLMTILGIPVVIINSHPVMGYAEYIHMTIVAVIN